MAKGSGEKVIDKGQAISCPDAKKKMMKKKKRVSEVKVTNDVRPAPVPMPDVSQVLASAPVPMPDVSQVLASAPVPLPDVSQALASAPVPLPDDSQALASAPVPLPDASQVLASAPVTNGSRAALWGKEKARDKSKQLSGFIFMCNAKTKPECFRYCIFGLPAGAKSVVEKIQVGTKLFLYDFDLKLLYGVFMATCAGQLNLEPSAFGGKFPAQVRFLVCEDCLPLPESTFKVAIKDNYDGLKFRQELSGRQLDELLSLFRPCVATTAAPVAPMPELARPWGLPPALDDHFQLSVRLPPPQDPSLAGIQHGRAALMKPHPMEHGMMTSQREMYGTEATMDRVYSSSEHQVLPARNGPYYFAENRQPYVTEDTAQHQYTRYRPMQEIVPHGLLGSEREYHQLPLPRGGQFELQHDNVSGYYNSYQIPAMPHGPTLTHPPGLVTRRPVLAARNAPVSSYYSFSGARLLNH